MSVLHLEWVTLRKELVKNWVLNQGFPNASIDF